MKLQSDQYAKSLGQQARRLIDTSCATGIMAFWRGHTSPLSYHDLSDKTANKDRKKWGRISDQKNARLQNRRSGRWQSPVYLRRLQ